MNRRQLLAATASSLTVVVAGCSGGSDTPDGGTETSTEARATTSASTPTAADSQTTTEGIPTASSEPDDEVADGVIETLADYEYVAERPDTFVGTEISAPDVSYYNEYGEYTVFRALYDEGTRPFFVRTDEEGFLDGDEYSFTGTVEKVGEVQGTPVIYVENAAFEKLPK